MTKHFYVADGFDVPLLATVATSDGAVAAVAAAANVATVDTILEVALTPHWYNVNANAFVLNSGDSGFPRDGSKTARHY